MVQVELAKKCDDGVGETVVAITGHHVPGIGHIHELG
jgi:hypothetical protein